jgi:cation diffusion facilitator CzcD-associated flavoprotein CzcO
MIRNMDGDDKICVLGGGPSGLVVAKMLLERGIACEILEREDDVGGTWYYGRPGSSVYASTHLISSKRMTEFSDFPMPKEYPPYPSHQQALAYLRSYARHFGLYEHLRPGSTVARIEPVKESAGNIASCTPRWRIAFSDGSSRNYRGVVIANGHHSEPLSPDFPGEFTGKQLHAHDYKTPDQIAGQRVLVVGGGNSGCDIAVEAAQHAQAVFHSLRRGYHFLPKFLLGTPIDAGGEWLNRWQVPQIVQRWLTGWLSHVALGPPERYGLPRPEHRLFEAHPIVNSQLLYFVGHGKIQIRPAIERLAGDRVRFADGSEQQVDTIIYATGYQVSFPFADRELLLDADGKPRLFLNVFHPRYDNLFVAGLVQPNSGIWPIIEWQARLVAAFISAHDKQPAQAAWFRKLKAGGPDKLTSGRNYLRSPRHLLEVPYFSYRRRLERLVGRLNRSHRHSAGRSALANTSGEPAR